MSLKRIYLLLGSGKSFGYKTALLGAVLVLRHTGQIAAPRCWLFCDSVTRLGDLLDFGPIFKPFATIYLPKSPTFVGNCCKGVKIFDFSIEIIFGQVL